MRDRAFAAVFGAGRRGRGASTWALDEAVVLWQGAHAALADVWHPDVPLAEFVARCEETLAALHRLDDALVAERGEGLAGQDFTATPEEPLPGGDDVFAVSLFGCGMGGLWAVQPGQTHDALGWLLNPGDLLVFDDDEDGELTTVELVTHPSPESALSDWLHHPQTAATALGRAQALLIERLRRRLVDGPLTLLDDDDVRKWRAANPASDPAAPTVFS